MVRRIPLVTWIFVSPALLLLAVFLVYPVINTIYLGFLDSNSTSFVGLNNYISLFTSQDTIIVFRNTALWLILFTGVEVALGLLLAVLTNAVAYESVAKAVIFIPMAISFTAAAVIWRFMTYTSLRNSPRRALRTPC